ncbi:MAG: DUF547 domain-containing protein [Cyclobacteriaceae bacterium]|nr:DUF547 domain-containing protein [Cyclobacteriaceae bacterium]
MKKLSLVVAFIGFSSMAYCTELESFFKVTDVFFKRYVSNSRVDYIGIKKASSDIENLVKLVGTMNLEEASVLSKKAFYVNAYNLIVIYAVIKNYPIKSPLDVSGFFDKATYRVAGEELTLNKLETEKLLRTYLDSRFHFVLVCAAKSCPPLANFAYTPDTIEQQLTERTKLAVNDSNWLRINPSKGIVGLSKIFDWYSSDFKSNGNIELGWINQYRNEKIPNSYKIEFYEYDWSLNEK